MARSIPESDWKLFRQLHRVALDRYCEKVLEEVQRVTANPAKTNHERYLDVYKLIERRDRQLGRAFNDLRRSTAVVQLAAIYACGVITEEEITRFTPETREAVSFLAALRE